MLKDMNRMFSTGNINSPTLCQYFKNQPLEMIHNQFPECIVYHYMDENFLSYTSVDTFRIMFEEVK